MTPFNFAFTKEKLSKILVGNKNIDVWFTVLAEQLPKYDICNVNRVAAFLAQTGHESNGFTVLEENLNYSAAGMAAVWPKRFSTGVGAKPAPNTLAFKLNRNPEAIANVVYANRMGNGNEASGDGWRYRGRGPLQITGHDNYAAVAKGAGVPLDKAVEFMTTPTGAVVSACWYWSGHKLNALADAGDMVAITKAINGGTIGLADRQTRYNSAIAILQG